MCTCSKRESSCLLDLPGKSKRVDYEKIGNKPGILYDADKQCEMVFGTGSKFCKEKVMNMVMYNILYNSPLSLFGTANSSFGMITHICLTEMHSFCDVLRSHEICLAISFWKATSIIAY